MTDSQSSKNDFSFGISIGGGRRCGNFLIQKKPSKGLFFQNSGGNRNLPFGESRVKGDR